MKETLKDLSTFNQLVLWTLEGL